MARSTPTPPPEGAAAGSKPRGAEAVTEALVVTATRLFARAGPEAVSVRDIAAAAGVNHALVFRHFGSKVGLLNAVLQRLGHRLQVELDADDPREAMEADVELFANILTRILLDGAPPESYRTDHPMAGYLVDRARADGLDDRRAAQLTAVMLALELGWTFYRPFVLAASGLDQFAGDAEVRATLDEAGQVILDALTDAWQS